MWNALKARLRQGYRTGKFPFVPPVLPDRFAGRPEINAQSCTKCGECEKSCPVGAVAVSANSVAIDTGKCIFCGKCAEFCAAGAINLAKSTVWRR